MVITEISILIESPIIIFTTLKQCKISALVKDAQSNGDPVLVQNYSAADHYLRRYNELNERRTVL